MHTNQKAMMLIFIPSTLGLLATVRHDLGLLLVLWDWLVAKINLLLLHLRTILIIKHK